VDLLAGLSGILPEDRIHTGDEELDRHGRAFFTYHEPHAPDAVVYPGNRDEVVQVPALRQRAWRAHRALRSRE
jgi:hypothetical protein